MTRGKTIARLSRIAQSGDLDAFKAELRDEASRIDMDRGKANLDEQLI